jgi:nucleoside permease NupC
MHVAAIIIAFVSTVSFLNAVVSFFADLIGLDDVTFEMLLGKEKH